ncbi:MAG TPA: hypothetical protein VG051_06980 [Candidatus Acidoferrum sp.]|jgi:hypothetical protein|nr:hypothetical protein [Candidatus Acidoferrum sp.]
MEGPFLVFYFFALYGGVLLPIPSVILAWREWVKTEKAPVAKTWRRTMSYIGLLLCTVGLAFAGYVAIAEGRNILSQQSYYDSWAMKVGVAESVATIAVSAVAEGKLRRYLLLCAVGLLCLFFFGFNEAI